jgi:hypothetical protein
MNMHHSSAVLRRGSIALLLWMFSIARADEKNDFKEHVVFKHIIGEWKSQGELKGKDGNIVTIKQEWKAEAVGANTLVIQGTRELNGNSETYKWTITKNPSTGLFEAELNPNTNNPDTLRFEMNVDEAAMKVEMSGFLGSDNSKVILVDQFNGAERDSFQTQITLSDNSGTVTLSGSMKNERVKKP